MLLFIALLAAGLFYWETNRFAHKINQQTYHDMRSLVALPFSLNELLAKSTLQRKQSHLPKLFFVLFPIIAFYFQEKGIVINAILFTLCYLTLLDYFYYLTDGSYVLKIFVLSLIQLLYFDDSYSLEKIHTLLFVLIFFSLFIPITQFLFKKVAFGSGDMILLIALSPLFYLEQMLQLLLIASLSGLTFASGYFLIKKAKLTKLPFIPFISSATFILFALEN